MEIQYLLIVLIGVVFLSGCVNQHNEGFYNLMDKLNFVPLNYGGNYQKFHEYDQWSGGSGASSYEELFTISIKVVGGEVTNYSMNYSPLDSTIREDDYPIFKEKYSEKYDSSKNMICREQYTTVSKCISTGGKTPIAPELKKPLMGCKMAFDSSCLDYYRCIVDGNIVQLYDDTVRKVTTPTFIDVWQEGLRFGCYYIKYYPETKEGICLYDAIYDSKYWAVLCNDNITLKPLVDNAEDLKNVVCHQKSYNGCVCEFNPTDIVYCSEEIPKNFDSETKNEIINYLNNNKIVSFREKNSTQYGTCYYAFYKKLKQILCFNQENIITFAQWGSNESSSVGGAHGGGFTDIDMFTVEKINLNT